LTVTLLQLLRRMTSSRTEASFTEKHASPTVFVPHHQRNMTNYDDYGMPLGAYSEPESLSHQAWRVARAFVIYRVKPEAERSWNGLRGGGWSWRRAFSLVKVLCLIWLVVVYRGERSAIRNSVEDCRWEKWENWVCFLELSGIIGLRD
jgi:hypothetical protein